MVLPPISERLTAIRRASRDIDKTLHPSMVAGFRDDGAAPGVTDHLVFERQQYLS
jgi:hypothetical protein